MTLSASELLTHQNKCAPWSQLEVALQESTANVYENYLAYQEMKWGIFRLDLPL